MNPKKKTFGKILLPAILAAALLSLTACGSGDSDNTSTISNVTNESSSAVSSAHSDKTDSNTNGASTVVSSVNGEVPYSFFNDAVFVGDSVSLKLNLYVSAQRKTDSNFMGTAQFLTPGSYGTGNELKELGSDNSVHPSYNGTEMYLADAIQSMGAKKVFIMLGMNDIAVYGNDGAVKNMETVLTQIKEKNPETSIYVQSMTPIVGTAQTGSLTNENLNIYNAGLKTMCEQNGYTYLDVASVMKDSEGNLKREYCSDPDNMGVHFTDEGCKVWIDYLRTHIA
ncbi:MAG: GDSL-type esterase/lipase family protein [Acutalibacteraceae bacterium]|nr:GDSL-type esterase/lipase family protein [Acutalibacteraceae bacterium]